MVDDIDKASFVKKGETLESIRTMVGLNTKAMAGELGLRHYHYLKLEAGEWKTPFYHLKAAKNVVRWIYSLNK